MPFGNDEKFIIIHQSRLGPRTYLLANYALGKKKLAQMFITRG